MATMASEHIFTAEAQAQIQALLMMRNMFRDELVAHTKITPNGAGHEIEIEGI